jgi:CheY-like chemotaxis protein
MLGRTVAWALCSFSFAQHSRPACVCARVNNLCVEKEMAVLRTLIVDDFEPFRRVLRAALEQRAEFQITGEAADGLAAVHSAQELQPDLILIDIGLPLLNGLEAAKRIRGVAPQAKLLFVSLECSSVIIRETFRLGGSGYVDKLRIKFDLLPAVQAIRDNRKFVSSGLDFNDNTDADSRHDVQFFSDDNVFVETVSPFLVASLISGNSAIVLATPAHRQCLAERLKESVDIDAAIRRGSYIAVDAADALSPIMVDGSPDLILFSENLGGLLEQANKAAATDRPRVAVFGECVGLLCAAGNIKAAIDIEKSGNELLKTHSIDILCAYPLSVFKRGEEDPAFRDICAEHTSFCTR